MRRHRIYRVKTIIAAMASASMLGLAYGTPSVAAQGLTRGSAPESVEDLQGLSIDELANLTVSSVSRRPESLSEVPSAIYVITSEDIRRSGANSLPELLRLAPNLEVARINAYSWTVSARGFNSPETSNKLLVLINGRSVYEPIGSGVLWQQVDVDINSITRIEVISGPGGTIWGANAVNGVINVITRPATQERPLTLQVSAGGYERSASLRFGGKLTEHMKYKIYANAFSYDATQPALPTDLTTDAFSGGMIGFRLGGVWGADSLSVKGNTYRNTIDQQGGTLTGHALSGSWARTLPSGSSLSVNGYYSHDERVHPYLVESRDTFNIDAQQVFQPSERHQIIWGGEYRHWDQYFDSLVAFKFADPKTEISLGSVFIQDEYSLKPNLKATLGLKAENSSYSGLNWLPNLRLAWQPDDSNLIWGAVSRAVRTPNRVERELEFTGILVPAPDFRAEKLTAFEAGWRGQPTAHIAISLSSYYNFYHDLRTSSFVSGTTLPVILRNDAEGETYGLEGWATYDVTANWRLKGGFDLLHKEFRVKPGAVDLANLAVAGMDPSYQAQIHSQWAVTSDIDFDIGLRTVGKIDNAPVPAYTEADAHLRWRVGRSIELGIDGLNLLHDYHLEVWDTENTPPRHVSRSVFATVRYGF